MMLQLTTQSMDVVSKLIDFLSTKWWSFILIAVVWFAIIAFLDHALDVHISPWWGAMALIVSIGIVLGIVIAI